MFFFSIIKNFYNFVIRFEKIPTIAAAIKTIVIVPITAVTLFSTSHVFANTVYKYEITKGT